MSPGSVAWFRTLGAPLAAADHALAQGYLCGLGLSGLKVRLVRSWQEAGELCRRPAGAWWTAETEERRRLGGSPQRAPASQVLQLGDEMQRAALQHAQRAGCEDPSLAYAAAGAASFAEFDATLARSAGAGPSHAFLQKQALFRAGRWPLGVYDSTLSIF